MSRSPFHTWPTLDLAPGLQRVDKIQVFSTLTLHRTPDLSYTTPDLLCPSHWLPHATLGLPYTTAELPCLTLPYTTPGLP